MHGGTLPLLEDHRIFHSRNVEEAYAFMRHKGFGLDIHPRKVGDFDMRLDGVYLPGMWFGYFQYGAPVVTRSVARDDYWVQLPVRGQIEAAGSSSSVECDMRRAAVLSPTRTDFYLVRSSDTCVRLCLSLYKASLVRQLTALLGEPPRRPLEFAPELDVTSGYGRGLIRHVLTMIAEVESGSMLANPVVLSSFEQFILTGVLMSHPHTYSEALRQLERPIAPRDVRRAVDFIEAHLNSSFTVAELVQATGVAGRTLFKHFKDFKGVSPMRYARNARFQQVRQALLRAEAEQGVTEIAASCGFAHLGRFAVEYRRRFGESPSDTLRRQRNSR